jgi:hypothetical protein
VTAYVEALHPLLVSNSVQIEHQLSLKEMRAPFTAPLAHLSMQNRELINLVEPLCELSSSRRVRPRLNPVFTAGQLLDVVGRMRDEMQAFLDAYADTVTARENCDLRSRLDKIVQALEAYYDSMQELVRLCTEKGVPSRPTRLAVAPYGGPLLDLEAKARAFVAAVGVACVEANPPLEWLVVHMTPGSPHGYVSEDLSRSLGELYAANQRLVTKADAIQTLEQGRSIPMVDLGSAMLRALEERFLSLAQGDATIAEYLTAIRELLQPLHDRLDALMQDMPVAIGLKRTMVSPMLSSAFELAQLARSLHEHLDVLFMRMSAHASAL